MLGWPEIILILVVVLVLFGAKKIPELARGLGTGIKEFKKATRDMQEELHRSIEDDPQPPPPPKKTLPPETVAKTPPAGESSAPEQPKA